MTIVFQLFGKRNKCSIIYRKHFFKMKSAATNRSYEEIWLYSKYTTMGSNCFSSIWYLTPLYLYGFNFHFKSINNSLHLIVRRIIVAAVLVRNAVNVGIGAILEMQQVGSGSKIARIGQRVIWNVIVPIVFTIVSSLVMVQHVILLVFLMVAMVAFIIFFLLIVVIYAHV